MPSVWRSNLYLLASFPVGIFTFVFFVTMLSVGVSLLIIWVGVPILIATVASTKFFAAGRAAARGLAAARADPQPLPAEPPPRDARLPPHRDRRRRDLEGHAVAADPAPDPRARGLHRSPSARWGVALGMVFLPLWYWSIPDGVDYGLFTVDKLPEAFGMTLIGLVLLVVAAPLTRAFGYGVGALARGVLAPSERRRLMELERTRAGAVDAQAAELQRIERDLHDGAQARLVALAMDLGMAQEKMATDPEGAQELITGAHSEAKKAIAELRDLSRGIYPAILTDRGLGPALSSIAARNPVEVALDVDLKERLPAATEAAAYFVTVEALTNVAKHSGAANARVRIGRRAEILRVEIADDGDGGADADGAGLTGLRQRVEALDGRLAVQSGDLGTTIRAELPCASSSRKT